MKWLFGLFMVMAFATPAPAQTPPAPLTEAEAERRFATIRWTDGPATAPVYEGATLALPEGYRMTDAAGARTFFELSEDIYGGEQSVLISSTAEWLATFQFDPSGRVSDEDGANLDADAILASLRQGTAAANIERKKQGFRELTIDGWLVAPRYNTNVKRLEWATRGHDSHGHSFANYDTRILGRHGVVQVKLVAAPEKINAVSLELNGILQGFSFREGNDYASWKSGDKVAAYGLTALITGTTAAVAAKMGLLQKLGLLFAKGGYVLIAAIAALFWGNGKRRKTTKRETPPPESTRLS